MPGKKDYGNESIQMLKGEDRVRLRPAVIFGSDNLEGCIHSFFEILSNSIDEAREGHGDKIIITRFADGTIEVEDFGRGIPMDYNAKEGRFNWELVYCELYAGGKYNNNSSGDYEFSLGLNGLGACATQYASEFFNVTVFRDHTKYDMSFKKGVPVTELMQEPYRFKRTGTIQRWKPDTEVFTEIIIPLATFKEIIKRQSVINSGIEFVLKDAESGEEFSFIYPEGIKGYVEELSDMRGFTDVYTFSGEGKGRDKEDRDEYKVRAEVAFCFNNEVNALEYFHNSSFLEHGGSPDKAVRNAFVAEIDKQIKQRDKYKANESRIIFQDVADSLILVTNTFSTQTSYENQTKKAINNKFIQEFLVDLIKTNLQIWFIEHKPDADKIIEQVLINKRSREQSESQRITVKKKLMEKTDVTNKVKKFVDCRSKDPEKRELFICEGDSALGSLLTARDPEYQALMPIRGKILNIQKASLQSVFASDIIMDLIRVMGCGIEVRGKKLPKDIPQFDEERLKFNKVIITADMDVDGSHIVCLVTTMIYKLCPQLIERGYLYYAMTPLFEITDRTGKKPETLYAFSDAERDKLVAGKDPKKITIQRSKGLGENDAEMMAKFITPGTRRFIRITSAEAEEMEKWFDLFMGNDVAPRKQYIEAHGHEFMDELDIS
ncbi:MAG: DNA topoisomerase [Saccharofermentans sp.]|nr:DNA topoisomerase [Saccharofermentans sp.]